MSSYIDAACYRHITPPTGSDFSFMDPNSAESYTSTYTDARSYTVSPEVEDIATPPQSPLHCGGPVLLPKVRSQDQVVDPVSQPPMYKHQSCITSTSFPLSFNEHRLLPGMRRSLSPPDLHYFNSGHVSSTDSSPMPSVAHLHRPDLAHARSASMSAVYTQAHSRNISGGNLDAAAIKKYICPRRSATPSHVPSSAAVQTVNVDSRPAIMPAMPHSRHSSQPRPQPLATELLFDSYAETPAATTLMDYLTAPNPSPSLVRRAAPVSRLQDMHFWWDIRNVRTWSDFNLATLQSIPGLSSLLDFPIPEPALAVPGRVSSNPDSVAALHDGYTAHYATKVNAALKVSLGNSHINIRAQTNQSQVPVARQQPDFISNYENDYERTIMGNGRGRVVGLVKPYSAWNSGMRAEPSGTAKISYQRELAHLYRFMREHSCRYGFLLTEIELICVRAGTDSLPHYGLLELAQPIQLSTHGRGEMTACLALWYLHMLAKNTPLQGQVGWRIDVGGPAALTRQHCQPRDAWMLKPEGKEKRDAKRNRGWVFPEEPLSRKECGKTKRGGWAKH